MELNLQSATSLLRQIDTQSTEENREDARLKATLEAAVQSLQVQGSEARVALPPDLQGVVENIIATRSDLQMPQMNKMDIPGAQTVFANMEKLIILFASMSRENREMNREATFESLMMRVTELNQSASEREKGADALRSSAGGALAMSLIGGTIGIAGGAVGARFTFKGGLAPDMVQHLQTGTQGATQLFSGSGALASSEGSAQNQLQQAGADKVQATAEESNAEFQRALAYENEFKDMASKMNEILRSMLEAKSKATEAAARA